MAKASWRKYFAQHFSAVSTASWKILYSLILAAAWCLATHRRWAERLPKAQPLYVVYLLSFLFWGPVLVVPADGFLTLLVMLFLALIETPFPTFLVMLIPASFKKPLRALLVSPFPAFFRALFPALLVKKSLTFP